MQEPNPSHPTTAYFKRPGKPTLAFEQKKTSAALPTLVFLGGFMSDMHGSKATALLDYAHNRGLSYLRFDYSGHGLSEGRFEAGTIGGWLEDVLDVLDHVIQGPVVLVGSSMGGWLMTLAALRRQDRIKALVGIAAAPDFTEDLMWQTYSAEQQETLLKEGRLLIPSDYDDSTYIITRALIEDGRRHLILRGDIAISCPVRLLQGMKDREVPVSQALTLGEKLVSDDVELTLVKAGDHRLSTTDNLRLLAAILDRLYNKFG